MCHLLILAAVLLVSACGCATMRRPAPPVPVYRAAPLMLDGKLDEPAWQRAVRLPICYLHGQPPGTTDAEAGHYVSFCWDAQYLYIGYEAVVASPVSGNNGTEEGPPTNRRRRAALRADPAGKVPAFTFEVLLAANADPLHLWELKHNAANDFASKSWLLPRDARDPVVKMIPYASAPGVSLDNDYIEDDGAGRLATAVSLRANPAAPGQVAGYTAELRLPLKGLRVHRALRSTTTGAWDLAGARMLALGIVQSQDAKPVWWRSVPDLATGWFHPQAARFHQLAFADAPPAQ